jgi:predicted RNase H-like HicB family nuclease
MKYRIVLTQDEETGSYIASCPELPGLCCTGDTPEEAKANARETIDMYLDAMPETLNPEDSAKLNSALERLKKRRSPNPEN